MLSAMIQMFLMSAYEGGVEAFDEDFYLHVSSGGEVIIAPRSGKDLPEDFKAKFSQATGSLGVTPIYAEYCNFAGMSNEEASECLQERAQDRMNELQVPMAVAVSYALVEIQAQVSMESDEAEALKDIFKSIPEINNLRIDFEDGAYSSFEDEGSEVEPEATRKYVALATGRPERETVINGDDHTNLRIALGQAQTVEEFLALI